MTILKALINSPSTKIYANYMGWFKLIGGKHRAGIYDSDNPRVIVHQIRNAKAIGIDGFIIDYYGPSDNPTHQASLELMMLCEEEDFEFSIMPDAGIFKYAADMSPAGLALRAETLKTTLKYIFHIFMASPKYSVIAGSKPLWEFGLAAAGIVMSDLVQYLPAGVTLMYQNDVGPGANVGSYAWVAGFPDAGIPYLTDYCARHAADLTPVVPCLFWRFNDTAPPLPLALPVLKTAAVAQSVWGGPARSIDAMLGATFSSTVNICRAYVARAGVNCPAVQICTYNDYEEGTEVETIIDAILGASQ